MTRDEIQKIQDLPVESVAKRNGLTVVRHKALCPFHEDHHASLSFRHNRYRCYACGAHGDGISLTMHMQHLSFPDACRWLADGSNIILTEYKLTINQKPMPPPTVFNAPMLEDILARARLGAEASEFLFRDRKLDPEVIRKLGIKAINSSGHWFLHVLSQYYSDAALREAGLKCGEGNRMHCYFATPCLLIPYRSVDGTLIGLQSRYLGQYVHFENPDMQARHEEAMTRSPRFQFLRRSHPTIFNLPILRTLQPEEELWIAEGCSDCWALLSSGRKAIAIPSATLLTPHNKLLLSQCASRNWHIFPDSDDAGEHLYSELLSTAQELNATLTRHQLPPDCKDFSDLWISTSPF